VTHTSLYFFTRRILSVFITVLIVASCAAPKKNQKSAPKVTTTETTIETEHVILASDYLKKAESASSEQAIALMLTAAKTYIAEQNPLKSLWLANKLSRLPLTHQQMFDVLLVKVESLLLLNHANEAEQQLSTANELIANKLAIPNYQYYALTSLIENSKSNAIHANYNALLAFDLNPYADDNDVMNIWNELSQLSRWELQALKAMNPPHISGWLDLILKTNKWGDNKLRLDPKIIEFQSAYPNHPAHFIAEQLLLVSQVETQPIKHIAILLPLSGKHKHVGEIVQEGMLANYNDSETTLHFIDTNALDFTTLTTQFTEKEIDHVIGPILKPNVDQYIVQTEIELPTLLLNIPTVGQLANNHFAFSMKREDEAIQAATVLASRNYKQPVLFSTQDSVSRKVATTFANKWQLLTGNVLETVTLEANEKMQKSLKTSLDIDVSRTRIRNLEAQIDQKIKTENRNRRDIDMVFIAAPSQFTRLIKPFIDVNTSTYSTTIPMFASSLSHNGSSDNAEIRDLNGLTFSEIPWLIKNKTQDKQAIETSKSLWPNRSESLQRIYALGYDSLSVINKLLHMKALPYLRHYGQTGELKMEKSHIISRSILWGKYTNGTVKEVIME